MLVHEINLVNCEQDRIGQTSSECFTCGMNVTLWNFSLYVLGQEIKYISYCGSQSKSLHYPRQLSSVSKPLPGFFFPDIPLANLHIIGLTITSLRSQLCLMYRKNLQSNPSSSLPLLCFILLIALTLLEIILFVSIYLFSAASPLSLSQAHTGNISIRAEIAYGKCFRQLFWHLWSSIESIKFSI